MARYDLDLRMGVDDKLVVADVDIGALSYSVDKQNLYIDALKEDKTTTERQMINADKAYAIRDKDEDIVAEPGEGKYSFRENEKTIASGNNSHAEGTSTIASGNTSHAEGDGTQSKSYASHAEGNSTIASGMYSHAEGNITQANGDEAHAEGSHTQANGDGSHAEGHCTIALGSYSHAEGERAAAGGRGSHAEGYGETTIQISGKAQTKIYSIDYIPEPEDIYVGQAIKCLDSIATIIDFDITNLTIKTNKTLSSDSDLESVNAIISINSAVGEYSHVGGYQSTALGDYSFAFGSHVVALDDKSVAFGQYNQPKDENEKGYLFTIGNGTNNANRSNVLALHSDSIELNENTVIDAELTVNKNTVIDAELTVNENIDVYGDTIFQGGVNFWELPTYAYTDENGIPKTDPLVNESKLNDLKKEIMEDVKEIADSIITDVWYRSSTPPEDVKQAKLLWIRYDDKNNTYGNGVLYYFNPALVNKENLTSDEVKNEANWIPMSATYY